MSAVWVVRNDTFDGSVLVDGGFVSIGWDEVGQDLSDASRDQLKQIVADTYPDKSAQTQGSWVGTLHRFTSEIAVGDLVVAPDRRTRRLNFATVAGDYEFHPDEPTQRHRRAVEWLHTDFDRHELSMTAQNTLGALVTVFSAGAASDELWRVAETAPATAVRRGLVLQVMLEVLRDAEAPLTRARVLEEIEQRITPTQAELSLNSSGVKRLDTFVGFSSGWAHKVGWISKGAAGWTLQPEGRAAVETMDGAELYTEVTRRYRQAHSAEKKLANDPRYARLVDALSVIGEGEWTSYTDLGEVTGLAPQAIGIFINGNQTDEGHRVLLIDGTCGTDFRWADGRDITQRDALEAEGLEFEGATADPAAHLWPGDLRERLEALGVVDPVARRAWLVRGSAVNGRDLVPIWRERGSVSLAASKLREVGAGITRAELKEYVDEDYSQASYAAKAAKVDEVHAFLSRMQLGDLVTTTSQGRLYFGTITGDPVWVASEDARSNLRRTVTWLPGDGVDYGDLPAEVTARLSVQHDVVELTQQLELLDVLVRPADEPGPAPEPPARLAFPTISAELADSLHVSQAWLQESADLLWERRQLIYYGPPGTGKTFIARALARYLAGEDSRVKLVQFHPAYTYEDFFEGYRPTDVATFELRPGPLRQIVEKARENPSVPFFMLIDEINRGNLAKIFGELYFLLEYRDAQIDLLYATDDNVGFTLPKNVFIIGTMNTADRSIALVDAAMRRRFAFEALHPSREPTAGLLRRWLEAEGHPAEAAELLDELNGRIADPDFRIGPSYFMKEGGQTSEGIARVWRTAILPLLEEHHYGELDADAVAAKYGLDALRRALAAKSAPPQESEPAVDDASDPAE